MIALLMQFGLSVTYGSVEGLRSYIVDRSVAKYREVEGLRLKIFLSDPDGDTFGALYLWETEATLEAALPELGSSVRNRWGITPRLQRFDVEAIVEGRHSTPDLARVGRALEAYPGHG
jgi:trans-2,3-dihydro-3-hydroxyanthranilate isomerase